MRILFLSPECNGFGVAERLQRIGQKVLFVNGLEKDKFIGIGIVDVVFIPKKEYSFENILNLAKKFKPDFIIMDFTRYGSLCDKLREAGYIVWGGNSIADKLEYDRELAIELCEKYGIITPPTYEFKTADEAKKFIIKNGGRWVYKPEGSVDATHTFVSKQPNSEDLLFYLDKLSKTDKKKFILQQFIEGYEISQEIYFNGKNYFLLNWTMEDKKFMNNDLGANTGCSQDVVKFFDKSKKLFRQGLYKLIPFLRQVNYIGQIDLNSIVVPEENKLYFLEFTPRFGYNSIYSTMELLGTERFLEIIYKLAQGIDIKEPVINEYSASVRLTIPPYPYKEEEKNLPVFFNKQDIDHIYWDGICKINDIYFTAGSSGCICIVAYKHTNLDYAIKKCYNILDNILLSDKQYRTDLGVNQKKKLKALIPTGWI
jgi:phosphoribosylamine--glycine ligase